LPRNRSEPNCSLTFRLIQFSTLPLDLDPSVIFIVTSLISYQLSHSERIDEEDLQEMLNNLSGSSGSSGSSGLQELSITGYNSFSTSPILPTTSVAQQLRSTRRLPNRARLSSLKLRHLSLFTRSFTSEGLKLLHIYIAPETLNRLTIIEHMESTSRSGSEMFPTLVVLNELIKSSSSNPPGGMKNYGRGDGQTREGIEAVWSNIEV
jgi:hypothetical protein